MNSLGELMVNLVESFEKQICSRCGRPRNDGHIVFTVAFGVVQTGTCGRRLLSDMQRDGMDVEKFCQEIEAAA